MKIIHGRIPKNLRFQLQIILPRYKIIRKLESAAFFRYTKYLSKEIFCVIGIVIYEPIYRSFIFPQEAHQ